MKSKKERPRRVTFAGFAIAIFRDRAGRVTVDIDSTDATGRDVHDGPHAIPRLRVTLNEEDRETAPDGSWRELENGRPCIADGCEGEVLYGTGSDYCPACIAADS